MVTVVKRLGLWSAMTRSPASSLEDGCESEKGRGRHVAPPGGFSEKQSEMTVART